MNHRIVNDVGYKKIYSRLNLKLPYQSQKLKLFTHYKLGIKTLMH